MSKRKSHNQMPISQEELPLSEEYYDTQALKSAVWFYLIDHAQPVPEGLRLWLAVRDEQDFWRRVSARKYGNYRKEDAHALFNRVTNKNRRLQELEIGQKKADTKEKRLGKLKRGPLGHKLRYHTIVALRRVANKLMP